MDADAALLVESLASFAAVALLSLAGLRAWRGWLALRRETLAAAADGDRKPDLAALRARVRRLEAIATGTGG
jgi:hypothetical protein